MTQEKEKQKLSKNTSKVRITGKVKINKNSFSGEVISKNNVTYKYKNINIGIETSEGNIVYAQLMGGYDSKKPVVYTVSKGDNASFEVNFADRLNDAIVENIADFKLHKVGLKRQDKDDPTSSLDMKKFASAWDVHDYLQEHLKDGMEITISGSYQFSEYKDEVQKKIQIQNIYLPFQKKIKDENGVDTDKLTPVQYHASFTQSILLNEDSFKRISKKDAEAGEVTIPCKVVDYVGKVNGKKVGKNFTFPIALTVKINKESPETTEKILDALFKVKKGKIRELTIEGDIVEGYEQDEVNEKDIELSPEIKELIALGLYSEEEARKKMTIRGSKSSKFVFIRPFLYKNDDKKLVIDMNDDKYVPADLVVVIEDQEDNSDDDYDKDDDGDSSDDNSWMKALGL